MKENMEEYRLQKGIRAVCISRHYVCVMHISQDMCVLTHFHTAMNLPAYILCMSMGAACIHVHMNLCVHTCVYAHMCICVCMNICNFMSMRINSRNSFLGDLLV